MARQCGSRKLGGVYIEVATSPFGSPLEEFLVCPPHVVDLEELGITELGVHLIEVDGVWHVFDIVGEDNYPNAPDILEEGRYMSFSRRASKKLDFSKLSADSRLVLIHRRASIANFQEYPPHFTDEERGMFTCPKGLHELTEGGLSEMCMGLWYHDLKEGLDWKQYEELHAAGLRPPMDRPLECGISYKGFPRPIGIKPKYEHAIFASFPIGRIVVVEDPKDNKHEESLAAARKCTGLPVDLVKE